MNSIKINSIVKSGNRIDYHYELQGDWSRYFNPDINFWVEYDQNIESVPDAVAVLPLVGNLIVMAAIFDGKILLDSIDMDFYDCIPEFLQGFQLISPKMTFHTENLIQVNEIVKVDTLKKAPREKNFLFFSGGVDACGSLISHLEEQLTLVTIWGADIEMDNHAAWEQTYHANESLAASFGFEIKAIRSSLRRFINEYELNQYTMKSVKDNWWSAFQHSVGMMCLAAPLVNEEYHHLYFAATYSQKDVARQYVIASDPKIDNFVRFAGCHVVHDGYEYSRQDKIRRICEFTKQNNKALKLRVCFRSKEGGNCCKCEKCSNTIMSILLEGYDPFDFGFPYDKSLFPTYFASGLQEMAREERFSFFSIYSEIHELYQKRVPKEEVPAVLMSFYKLSLEELADFLCVPCNECFEKEQKMKSFDEAMSGKEWLEKEYHLLKEKILLVEAEDEKKRIWIQKLEKDIQWLEGEVAVTQQQSLKQKKWKLFHKK